MVFYLLRQSRRRKLKRAKADIDVNAALSHARLGEETLSAQAETRRT
jgi:hypothetical protein